MKTCYCLIYLFLASCLSSVADTKKFRCVKSHVDIEAGCFYTFVSPMKGQEGYVYAATLQTQTGEDYYSRQVTSVALGTDGLLVAEGYEPALFKLVEFKEGIFGFLDVDNGGWLAYKKKKASSSMAHLYTIEEEELSDDFYRTFKFDFSSPTTWVWTTEKIEITSRLKRCMGIAFQDFGNMAFKLYDVSNEPSMVMYKLLEPPVADTLSADWSFRGDWHVDELAKIDFSTAVRIDFSEAYLYGDSIVFSNSESLPCSYVWSYVSSGMSEKLPKEWPNVIEVANDTEGLKKGTALTCVCGEDARSLPPKYPFEVPSGLEIKWMREFPSDGGWSTICLPFVPERIMHGDMEDVTICEFAFLKEWMSDRVVFQIGDVSELKFGEAALVRVKDGYDTICFSASNCIVDTMPVTVPVKAGLYPAYEKKMIEDLGQIFLLSDDGHTFVKASQGSWIAPYRAYLFLSEGMNKRFTVRVIDENASCLERAYQLQPSFLYYDVNGLRVVDIREMGDWIYMKKGLYIGKRQKILVR